MTGTQLWEIFLAAQIPDARLRALGEDIGYKKDRPSSGGHAALEALSAKGAERGAAFTAGTLFGQLKNFMPGIFSRKSLLEGLADDYDKRRAFASCKPDTRNYLGQVAAKLPAIAPRETPMAPPPPVAKLETKLEPEPKTSQARTPAKPAGKRFFRTVSQTEDPTKTYAARIDITPASEPPGFGLSELFLVATCVFGIYALYSGTKR